MMRDKRNTAVPSLLGDYVTDIAPLEMAAQKPEPTKKAKVRVKIAASKDTLFATPPVQTKTLMENLGITDMQPGDYIPSPLDQDELVKVKVVNLLKESGGHGLFAVTDIPVKTCIGEYTGERYTEDAYSQHLQAIGSENIRYALTVASDIVDAAVKGNFTRYMNYSDTQENVEYVQQKIEGRYRVRVMSLRNIKAGEQLLANYNVYSEDAAKKYYFLNPSDGAECTFDIYTANIEHYSAIVVLRALPLFNCHKNDKICIPLLSKSILYGHSLSAKYANNSTHLVNLPCISMDDESYLTEFHEKDTISPLMLACYLGQLDNVIWLIRKGANVNQQQNRSGVCALSTALQGYLIAPLQNRDLYFQIIKTLIYSGANVLTRDRNEKTFLHAAVSILSDEHFNSVIVYIKTNQYKVFSKIPNAIDEENNDLLMLCLREKHFAKFICLFKKFPNYLANVCGEDKDENFTALRSIIEDFSDHQKALLVANMKSADIKLDNQELIKLGLLSNKRLRQVRP